jgi:DNA polymerase III epsilon subunit-like protein
MAKEMFPASATQSDALCDRLGVDNSGRTLHGALLDAELLADVYINLTRGQDALLIDLGTVEGEGLGHRIGRSEPVCLPVLQAKRAGTGCTRGSACADRQVQRRQNNLAPDARGTDADCGCAIIRRLSRNSIAATTFAGD